MYKESENAMQQLIQINTANALLNLFLYNAFNPKHPVLRETRVSRVEYSGVYSAAAGTGNMGLHRDELRGVVLENS